MHFSLQPETGKLKGFYDSKIQIQTTKRNLRGEPGVPVFILTAQPQGCIAALPKSGRSLKSACRKASTKKRSSQSRGSKYLKS